MDREEVFAQHGLAVLNGVPDGGWRRSGPDDAKGLLRSFDPNEEVAEITGPKVFLWLFSQANNGGKNRSFSWQLTGSCVNSGMWNALVTQQDIEIACLPQPEIFEYPFTLAAYGLSRQMIGDSGEGEGSSGDAIAKAMQEGGAAKYSDPAIPEKPFFCGPAVVYNRAVELKYSSYRNCPESIRQACSKHTLQYTTVQNSDQALKELRRGRVLTFAGDWGGLMQCEYAGTGDNRVLMSKHADSWSHQQSCHGAWEHPTFGLLFYILNNWYQIGTTKVRFQGRNIAEILEAGISPGVHGQPAQSEPEGGYWVTTKDMDYQCRTGEVRGIGKWKGYGEGLLRAGAI